MEIKNVGICEYVRVEECCEKRAKELPKFLW